MAGFEGTLLGYSTLAHPFPRLYFGNGTVIFRFAFTITIFDSFRVDYLDASSPLERYSTM